MNLAHVARSPDRRLRLVAANRDSRPAFPSVPASGRPETMLVVSFTGLTEAEQRAAIAGFPGGKRFRLVSEMH